MQHRPQTGFSSRLQKPSGLHHIRQVGDSEVSLEWKWITPGRARGRIVGGDNCGLEDERAYSPLVEIVLYFSG